MGAMNPDISITSVLTGEQCISPRTDNVNSWANIVVQGAARKQVEVGTKDRAMVKDSRNGANSTEEDRLPAGEDLPRDKQGLTPPRELWSFLILEENPCEEEVHRNQEGMRMDMESTSGSAERAGDGSMMQERASIDQEVEDEGIENDDSGKTRDEHVYKQDDNGTGMDEDENPYEEERNTAQPQHSPKRIKKLKMEREAQPPRERTRSKTKTRTSQRL